MEVTEVLFIGMALVLTSGFLFLLIKNYGNFTKNRRKSTASDTEKEVLKNTIRTMQETHAQEVQQLKKRNQSLNNTINRNRYSRKEDDDENEEEEQIVLDDYEIDKESVRPFLQNWGMNADALDNPILSRMIASKFKGHEELMITLGLLKPKGSNQSSGSNVSSQPGSSIPAETYNQIQSWA